MPPKEEPTCASDLPLPIGLGRCKQYGIRNVILEVDVRCITYKRFQLEDFRALFQERLDAIREFSPNARVLVNLRDAPTAYFEKELDRLGRIRPRLWVIIKALSMLTPQIFGLAFEDPVAELLPWDVGVMTADIKRHMVKNKWADGQLLIHVSLSMICFFLSCL